MTNYDDDDDRFDIIPKYWFIIDIDIIDDDIVALFDDDRHLIW